jgi:hypothetical protein
MPRKITDSDTAAWLGLFLLGAGCCCAMLVCLTAVLKLALSLATAMQAGL